MSASHPTVLLLKGETKAGLLLLTEVETVFLKLERKLLPFVVVFSVAGITP